MISLDGKSYAVRADSHRPKPDKPVNIRMSVNNCVDFTAAKLAIRTWSYTLQLDYTQLQTLIATWLKNEALHFTDEEGVTYDPDGSGSDTPTMIYGIGVYIRELGDFTNLGPILITAKYNVPISLIASKAVP